MAEERMDPASACSASFWEHAYRYRFATTYVADKLVLDIACGEGYGTAALRKAGARGVVGMDICPETCRAARSRYGEKFCVGDAQAIPLADHSIEVIVSFETIEHVERPDLFLDECVRVLVPEGILIVSTPNKAVHRESAERNPFHRSEMNEDEFFSLLASRFNHTERYMQIVKRAPWWSARSLAATHSPWVRIKGGWRMREWLRSRLCSRTCREIDEEDRHSPVEAILSRERFFASWLNPYCVRSCSSGGRERPWYWVAVSHR